MKDNTAQKTKMSFEECLTKEWQAFLPIVHKLRSKPPEEGEAIVYIYANTTFNTSELKNTPALGGVFLDASKTSFTVNGVNQGWVNVWQETREKAQERAFDEIQFIAKAFKRKNNVTKITFLTNNGAVYQHLFSVGSYAINGGVRLSDRKKEVKVRIKKFAQLLQHTALVADKRIIIETDKNLNLTRNEFGSEFGKVSVKMRVERCPPFTKEAVVTINVDEWEKFEAKCLDTFVDVDHWYVGVVGGQVSHHVVGNADIPGTNRKVSATVFPCDKHEETIVLSEKLIRRKYKI